MNSHEEKCTAVSEKGVCGFNGPNIAQAAHFEQPKQLPN